MRKRKGLLAVLGRATNRKKGQVSLDCRPEHKMRTFMCSFCGLLLKLPTKDWKSHRGSKIPPKHGCPRCIGKALRKAYKDSPKWSHGAYESGQLIGATTLQAEHGMQWLMDEERKG